MSKLIFKMTDKSTTMESDSFFRHLDQDYYEVTDGNVEAPTGWFGLVKIDDVLRDLLGTDQPPASVADGLYLVQVNEQGLVWAFQTDGYNEATLRFNFNDLVREYSAWAEDNDE